MWVGIPYVPGAHGGQKRMLDPLEPELQIVMRLLLCWVLGAELRNSS